MGLRLYSAQLGLGLGLSLAKLEKEVEKIEEWEEATDKEIKVESQRITQLKDRILKCGLESLQGCARVIEKKRK